MEPKSSNIDFLVALIAYCREQGSCNSLHESILDRAADPDSVFFKIWIQPDHSDPDPIETVSVGSHRKKSSYGDQIQFLSRNRVFFKGWIRL